VAGIRSGLVVRHPRIDYVPTDTGPQQVLGGIEHAPAAAAPTVGARALAPRCPARAAQPRRTRARIGQGRCPARQPSPWSVPEAAVGLSLAPRASDARPLCPGSLAA
jgi:hypothetical protein